MEDDNMCCVERHCSVAAVQRCLNELQRRAAVLSLPTDEPDESPNRYRIVYSVADSVWLLSFVFSALTLVSW